MPPMTNANPFHLTMTHAELEAALGSDNGTKIEGSNHAYPVVAQGARK